MTTGSWRSAMSSQVIKRQAQYEKRLSSILRTASKIIAREGFDGASIRTMAGHSRIGLSAIYYYFKNKDELLYAIQHHAFTTLVSNLRERFTACNSPEEKLRAIIENHFEFFVKNRDEFKVCVHEIDSLSGKYYKNILVIRQEYFRLVREVVGEIFHHEHYEIDMATFSLFGSLNWVYMWYDPAKNADVQKITDQFLRVFLNGKNGSKGL